MNKDAIIKLIENNKTINYKELNKKCKYSVSKIIETLKEPFDAEGQAERCSKKYKNIPGSKYYNMEPWDILEAWDNKRKQSIHIGCQLDNYIGCILEKENEKMDKLFESEKEPLILSRFNVFNDLYNNQLVPNNFKFACREMTICDYEHGWKGRFDAMFTKDDDVLLIDWKSNEEISTENGFQNLKGPLYKYCASDLNGYTVQLFLYKYALEKYYGFKDVKVLLCQINDKKYNFYKPEIPYSEELVESILRFALNKLSKADENK